MHQARSIDHYWSFWLLFAALTVSGVVRSASAQVSPTPWTTTDAYTAFSSYNNTFYFAYASKISSPQYSDGYAYRTAEGSYNSSSNPQTSFWNWAEQIEMVEDAYNFANRNGNSTDASNYKTMITQLCDGFIDAHGTEWWNQPDGSDDEFNDDLEWASIAFIRAYEITGNAVYLRGTAGDGGAAANINEVWTRGLTSYGSYQGIIQKQGATSLASYSNWPFVIATEMLRKDCPLAGDCPAPADSNGWQDMANTIYSYAINNLYVSSGAEAGQVYDNICLNYDTSTSTCTDSGGEVHTSGTTESYSYGVAMGATVYVELWNSSDEPEGGYNAMAQQMATFLETNLHYGFGSPNVDPSPQSPVTCSGDSGADWKYSGQENGYYILPVYCSYSGSMTASNAPDYAGFNGIALRWLGLALLDSSFNDNGYTLAWAQENVEMAWGASYQGTQSNSQNLSWNDWAVPTAASTTSQPLYSWDCSDAIVGLMNIQAP